MIVHGTVTARYLEVPPLLFEVYHFFLYELCNPQRKLTLKQQQSQYIRATGALHGASKVFAGRISLIAATFFFGTDGSVIIFD